jgi:integrase
MPEKPVTDQAVRAFAKEHAGHRAEMPVGGPRQPGLVARVAASGKVSFALRYRDRGGTLRTLTMQNVRKASVARDRADELLARAGAGVDPWEAIRAEKMAKEEERRRKDRTLALVAERWLGGRAGTEHPRPPARETAHWRARTRRETWRLLDAHWIPALGTKDPAAIARKDVRAVLTPLEERAPSEARHAFAALRGLYAWLLKERQEHLGVMVDPTAGMDKPGRVVERSRVYSDDDLRALLRAARGDLRDLVELLLCTGTRDSETRAMRWADVDLDRALWTIPADRSKNRRPHVVALSSRALTVLRRRPRFGEFAFPNPATREGCMGRNSKELADVAIGAGLLAYTGTKDVEAWEGEGLRLHDIRRTVGDRVRAELGEATMHGVLGHADAALTRTYGPTPRLRALADAMEWWAGELARILGEPAPAQGQRA